MTYEKTPEQIKWENKKLKAEARNAHWSWIVPLVQMVPTIALIVTTYFVAKNTGILDAKKERLATEFLKLEVDKEKTIGQIAKLNETVKKLESDVQTHAAIEKVNEQLVTLSGSWVSKNPDGTLFLRMSKPANSTEDHVGDTEVLKSLDGLKLGLLSIYDLRLDKAEVRLIANHKTISYLDLKNNSLTDGLIEDFSHLRAIKHLLLSEQNLTTLKAFSTLEQLSYLQLNDCPISNEGFLALGKAISTLWKIDLDGTELTDEIIPFFQKCEKLSEIGIGQNSQFSDSALQSLLDDDKITVKLSGRVVVKVKGEKPRLIPRKTNP